MICDEPVSALDLSIQAQVLNLLAEMKRELGLSYLFISHDLSVVRYFADRILVMYLGRIVEMGAHDALWRDPKHPYTGALMASVPGIRHAAGSPAVTGDLPSSRRIPAGCRFHPRCPLATEICRVSQPELRPLDAGRSVACHHAS